MRKRISYPTFYVGLLLILSVLVLLASANIYYRVNRGQGVIIKEHSVCRKVINNGQHDIFVPTRTSSEWSNFLSHTPPGVNLASCCPPGSTYNSARGRCEASLQYGSGTSRVGGLWLKANPDGSIQYTSSNKMYVFSNAIYSTSVYTGYRVCDKTTSTVVIKTRSGRIGGCDHDKRWNRRGGGVICSNNQGRCWHFYCGSSEGNINNWGDLMGDSGTLTIPQDSTDGGVYWVRFEWNHGKMRLVVASHCGTSYGAWITVASCPSGFSYDATNKVCYKYV